MRHVASALLMSALAMGTAGCQSPFGGPAAGAPAAGEEARHGRVPRAASLDEKSGRGALWVGDAVDVDGRRFGEHLRVSVVGQVDPAVTADSVGSAASADSTDDTDITAGTRRLAVDVTVVNTGGRPYDASSAGAWAVDEKGRRHRPVASAALTTGRILKGNTIPAGEQAQGWRVFEVPEKTRIVRLQLALENRSLDWQLSFPPSR
ncbi:DUF4352 domain-containing protein [Streptomyces katsurahamanus]|uniref:DUF4352 domain-containing protein n=1 Tax=Streptomyces katsurahamanus TaxID=2577098 RepID=A0ABW9NQ23_9ACTN|nr:DUF4352 domain-containing protein [Streptomyces katsurahamanus]MQS35406.1 DUF4352 domain-containing protein [Streptomyces katsurahamanus]